MSQKYHRRSSIYTRKLLSHAIPNLNLAIATHTVIDPPVCNVTEGSTLSFPARLIDLLASCTEKSRICIIPRAAPTREALTVHQAARQKSRISQRTLIPNTSQRRLSHCRIESTMSWISIHIFCSIATNDMTTTSQGSFLKFPSLCSFRSPRMHWIWPNQSPSLASYPRSNGMQH